MVYRVSIDPGVHRHAVALWDDRELQWVKLDTLETIMRHLSRYGTIETVWIEIPRVYPGGHARPNDLVDLAFSAGRIVGEIAAIFDAEVHAVTPSQWKGSVSKPISHHRIYSALSSADRAKLPAETADRIQAGLAGKAYEWAGHNLLDAVGIGQYVIRII